MDRQGTFDIATARLVLKWMSPSFIEASLVGRTDEAEAILGATLPFDWPDDETRRRLAMRLDQMRDDSASARWLLRSLVRQSDDVTVGIINFHGPPDDDGCAELGYTVFEEHRRNGYASEAAIAMMSWALTDARVRTFVLSISPQNQPSLAMAKKLGFRRVGNQMDEVDGEEWVFHLDA